MKKLSIDSEIFTRTTQDILTREELSAKLKNNKQLRIKFGVDITASTLHIGNAVNLWKMRELQEYGHKVVFLIGDFTTTVGDPTGRLETRKNKPNDTSVWANNFIKQVGKILKTDKKVFEVRRNSEWYGKMKAKDLFELFSFFTHARMIERDMFQKRISGKKEILLSELLYPVLQGYDSVMLKSDLTIIGSDQLFNENVGRFLQEKYGQSPQVLITTKITPGINGGPKMSKSLGNYIGLEDSPQDKFGKAMRVLDELIVQYLEAYTDVSLENIRKTGVELTAGKNPMDAKLFFAEALVRRYHGEKTAREEKNLFMNLFSKKDTRDIPEVKIPLGNYGPLELLVRLKFAGSKAEGRRLVQQGAVDIDGIRLNDPTAEIIIKKGTIIQVGKRRFVRIK